MRSADRPPASRLASYRELIARLLGEDASAAGLVSAERELAFAALCARLEETLADPDLDIDDTQTVVALLKDLAHEVVTVEDVV